MKLIKNIIILLVVSCQLNVATAQVSGNLILNNRPPSYLSDWNSALTGQLILTSAPTGGNQQVKLETQILDGAGNIIGRSNTATARIINLNPGANIININAVLQLDNMQFTSAANSLARSGKLSPGEYQLCVQLFSIDNQPLPFKQCRMFSQVNYQLPYLLTPTDKFWIDANVAQTAIIFRWSSLVPATQEAPIYKLQVFEVRDGMTPMQALRSNQPILETELRRATQYIWRPQLSFKDSSNHIFIWTVQTLDSKGQVISTQDANTQGRSEPRMFGICNKQSNTVPGSACGADYNWE